MDRREKVWAVFRVGSGNFLEMYDFMVFGYYAGAIGRAFFPSGNELASLMLSLITFGAGFLMRPIGAVVLGSYMDRHGRRRGLLLTLTLMSVGTLLIAVMPGYATVGLIAPVLIVISRLLQGFSAGAELGGVSVYLAEIATPGRQGFYVSWQSASQQLAVIFAALLGVLLVSRLSPEAMVDWGWRVPLLVGCLIVPVLFLIRRSLGETPVFLARRRPPGGRELLHCLARNWRAIGVGTLLVTMTTVSFYLITVYTPTFGSVVLKLEGRRNLIVALCVGFSNLFWLPVMGSLSDRVGPRPILMATSLIAILTAYPAMAWLVSGPSFGRLLAVELWLSFLFASYSAPMLVYLTEILPAEARSTGFALAYSLATALFGGFTPAINTYLIYLTGNRAVPGAWLALAAGCGLVATVCAPFVEGRNVNG